MNNIFAVYDIKSGNIKFDSNCVSVEDDNMIINISGTVFVNDCPSNANDISALKDLYFIHKSSITKHISGTYIILIYNKVSKEILVVHDMFSSPITLYYTIFNGRVFMGTSVKQILKVSGMPRKLNCDVLDDFFLNGFINSSRTLIENLKKISVYHALQIHHEKMSEIPVSYTLSSYTTEQAKEKWFSILDNSITSCLNECEDVSLALSSGYDSNFILYSVSKAYSGSITAFSVGGKSGTNELPIVRENIKQYPNVKLFESLVTKDSLQQLPDIIWRLEGSTYERGIFLQYALAKQLNKMGKSTFLCGECADQVLNKYFYKKEVHHPNYDGEKPKKYFAMTSPYEMAALLFLKKSGIMLNSFDITGKYPFLDREVISVAKALRRVNGTGKVYHKQKCIEVFPSAITKNLKKIGGNTSFCALLESEQEKQEFFRFVEQSRFYKKGIGRRLAGSLRMTGFNIAKKLIRERKNKDITLKFLNNEYKISEHLFYMYMIVFEELFISGKYDSQYSDKGIDLTLDKILNRKTNETSVAI